MPRTALVTGGAQGIGAAVAAALREDGLRVLVADIAEGDLVVDVSDPAAVEAHAAVLDDVDVLINNAGIVGPNRPLWEVSPDEWDRTMAVNVRSAYLLCRAVVPGMRRRGWGRVVNLASIAAKEGNPRLAAYSASKAALVALTKSLAKEVATDGVLVNVVTPAVIRTPMNEGTDPEVLEYMISRIPMGRLGEPAEVAELVRWLSSDACTFSTGAVFDLSGGRATY